MIDELKNLGVMSIISRKSESCGEMKNRRAAAFNIRLSGEMEYCFKDRTILVKEGEMIYLPTGSDYTYRVVSQGDSMRMVVNLSDDFFPGEPKHYSLEHFLHSYTAFSNFADLWNFGSMGDRFMCLSFVYELCSFAYNYNDSKYTDKKKFKVIEPAVEYLKKHIYDADLKIDKLHQLCGVSHTYFRKIFISEFAMSPKEYVVEKRLTHAKSIIDCGEMDTVKDLALLVGYMDPLYFSKAFKARYGVSPLNMNLSE